MKCRNILKREQVEHWKKRVCPKMPTIYWFNCCLTNLTMFNHHFPLENRHSRHVQADGPRVRSLLPSLWLCHLAPCATFADRNQWKPEQKTGLNHLASPRFHTFLTFSAWPPPNPPAATKPSGKFLAHAAWQDVGQLHLTLWGDLEPPP